MINDQKKSHFGLGLVIGSVLGGLVALLLSPYSGKKNRDLLNKKMDEWRKKLESGELQKEVEDIFGDLSDESVKIYVTARETVVQKINELKNMDGDDYARMIKQVVSDVVKGTKINAEKLKKLEGSLIKDWSAMKKEAETEAINTKKKIKK